MPRALITGEFQPQSHPGKTYDFTAAWDVRSDGKIWWSATVYVDGEVLGFPAGSIATSAKPVPRESVVIRIMVQEWIEALKRTDYRHVRAATRRRAAN